MEERYMTVNRASMAAFLETMQDGEKFRLRVTGQSMMPMLFHGISTVTLIRQRIYKPCQGDVVLFFRPNGAFVLHRVHRIEADGVLIVKGDAQNWTERISPHQVTAMVTSFCRRYREISVDGIGYRIYCVLWRPFRPLHPYGAKAVYLQHRLLQKIRGKKNF